MTIPRALVLSALLATPVAACDAEAPGSPGSGDSDYRAVGHIDLDEVKSAPWLKDMLGDDAFDIGGGDLEACADVLKQAQAITFGAGEDVFEVYVQGSFDAAAANACSEHIDAEVAKRGARAKSDHPTPEAVMLADDLFVVFGGDLTPSPARLRGLLAADPSPKGDKPMWVVATSDDKDAPVEHVTMWADPSKGLDAHVEVEFVDEQKAAEIYGKANLGLVALQFSGEAGELASAVDLDSSGNTMTVEVHATPKQLKTLIDEHGVGAKVRAHHGAHRDSHQDSHGSFKIQVGASPE